MDRPDKIFDTRIRSANIARRNLPYVKVSENDKQHMVNSLFGRATQNPNRLIYIHIPFCRHICPFCIYQKQKTDDINLISDYFDVLIRQIQTLSSTTWADSASFKAVYFGGGTPTSVPVEYLELILNELKKRYRLADDCEITIESTITDINPAMVSRLKSAGVNRISLGVQSFNSQAREKLGRRATQEQIAETVRFNTDIGKTGKQFMCVDKGKMLMCWHLDRVRLAGSALSITCKQAKSKNS